VGFIPSPFPVYLIPIIYPVFLAKNLKTPANMSEQPEELSQVTYEQLAAIEDEFEDIDTQISTFSSSPNSLTSMPVARY
jgi:hypothetical protein